MCEEEERHILLVLVLGIVCFDLPSVLIGHRLVISKKKKKKKKKLPDQLELFLNFSEETNEPRYAYCGNLITSCSLVCMGKLFGPGTVLSNF